MIRNRRKSKTLYKLLLSLFIVSLCFLVYFISSVLFKVRTIKTNAKEEDIASLQNLKNRSIFSRLNDEVFFTLTKNYHIKSASVQKHFPDTLFIEVIYREPLAVIIAANGQYAVDSEGIILDTSEQIDPRIYLSQSTLVPGNQISQKVVLDSLKIVAKTKDTIVNIKEIIPAQNNSAQLVLDSGTEVIIDNNINVDNTVSSLQTIVRRFTIEGKSVSKIDYRFEKPVITF